MDRSEASMRTPAELAIKSLTIHVVTTANYVYLCTLQRRQRQGFVDVIRILFFLFVPPLLWIELFYSFIQALLQFVKNQADADEVELSYYASVALGLNSATKNSADEVKNRPVRIPLTSLSEDMITRHKTPRDWAWAGKLLLTMFTLIQGIGTVVLWGRRLDHGSACFLFDHRNGLMGITSIIISLSTLCILLLRIEWSTNQPVSPLLYDSNSQRRRTLLIQVLASYMVETSVIHFHSEMAEAGIWRVIDIGNHVSRISDLYLGHPATVLILLLIYCRKEVAERVGLRSILVRIQDRVKLKTRQRLKLLAISCCMVYVIIIVVTTFVVSVWEVEHYSHSEDVDPDHWWQDPISEKLLVI